VDEVTKINNHLRKVIFVYPVIIVNSVLLRFIIIKLENSSAQQAGRGKSTPSSRAISSISPIWFAGYNQRYAQIIANFPAEDKKLAKNFKHLGIFSDIVAEAGRQGPLLPLANPGMETQLKVRQALGWCDLPEEPLDLRQEHTWEKDGVSGEALSWSCGYGPRTAAWLLKPTGATGALPGVLALHDHGGFKWKGKEKIAEGAQAPEDYLKRYRETNYGGRAWANALAREGYTVLVHDAFLWGSRKFPIDEIRSVLPMEIPDSWLAPAQRDLLVSREIAEYHLLAGQHEHIVEKYLNLLGTNLAGVVAHEDRIALNVLRARADVRPDQLACMGLSGGGNRAGLLRATAQGLKAAVIVGLMSTYAGLLDQHVATHTWMFFPSLWARSGEWPDLVACQAPAPLLVQYDLQDDLFSEEGMRAADARLKALYASVGDAQAYCGQFYPGPHKFDVEMQAAAFAWLKEKM
jgi:dienelactone hydrolase